jgi:hypothetical protein
VSPEYPLCVELIANLQRVASLYVSSYCEMDSLNSLLVKRKNVFITDPKEAMRIALTLIS